MSRSGKPKGTPSPAWVSQVQWVQEDSLVSTQWASHISRDKAPPTFVISCVGAFGSQDFMRKACGELTVRAARAAAEADAAGFGFVSALRVNAPSKDFPLSLLARGYFEGKESAEKAILELFPQSHLILRPGVVVSSESWMRSLVGLPFELAYKVLGRSISSSIPVLRHSCPPMSAHDIGDCFAAFAQGNTAARGEWERSDVDAFLHAGRK